MKKLFSMLTVLFIIYFVSEIIVNMFGKGHILKYTVSNGTNNFEISETYVANTKEEISGYFLEISIANTKFPIQTYASLYGSKRIVKDIYYYKDDKYECIFPIFIGNRVLTDVICINNGILKNYTNIVDSNVSKFVDSIDLYDNVAYADDKKTPTINGVVTVFPSNVSENHYVSINNYKGIYTISARNLKRIYNVELFSSDTYKRPISALVDEYYVTANYDQKYSFDRFIVVNLLTNNETEIKVTESLIDHDSYIQGVVDGSLYIFDRTNKKQYEVNIKTSSIIQVGSVDAQVKYYKDGIWTRISAYEAAKHDYVFESIKHENIGGYNRVDVVGTDKTGFTYYYKKTNNGYDVFKTPNKDKSLKMYIFSTNKINDIKYVGEYVYYSSGVEVKYYSDKTGNRTLFKNTELDFNSSLYFDVYKK